MRNLKPSAPNLNVSALETEFKNLDIDIHLAKIDYSQRIDKTVSLALKEITEKQANHLNPIILESEQNKLNGEPANDKEIDNLLNQILLWPGSENSIWFAEKRIRSFFQSWIKTKNNDYQTR